MSNHDEYKDSHPDPTGELAAAIYQAVERFADHDRSDYPAGDLNELVHVWNLLDSARTILTASMTRWAHAAGAALADVDYDPRAGLDVDGVLVHHVQRSRDEWNGAKVLDLLARPVVDPETGEVTEAVPRSTLDDVLPAVTGGATSSRWKRTGLKQHGVDPGTVCRRDWQDPRILASEVAVVTENLAGPMLQPKVVTDGGPWAQHNMPCAVCRSSLAVLNLDSGVFEPCGNCQQDRWRLVIVRPGRVRGWLRRFVIAGGS